MGRFKKFKQPKITTVIGNGTEIKGNLAFSGGLHVDGVVIGDIIAEPERPAALTLSEQGGIEGDVRVPNVIINGSVKGDVYASGRVELAHKARVTGTVYYQLLEMAMGAEVNGQLVHTEELEQRRLGYDNPPDADPGSDDVDSTVDRVSDIDAVDQAEDVNS